MGTFVENVNLIATGIQQVYDNLPEILLADDNAAICTAMASVCTSTYDQFDDRYLGAKATAPLVDNDGNALVYGSLYFDTTQNFMKVWSNAGWINAGSSVNGTTERYVYSATAGQTVFVATYEAGYIDVFLNGSKLQNGVDFTAITATNITLTSPASLGDVVDIICYAVFELSTAPTKDVVAYTVNTVADLASVPSSYTTAIVKDIDRGGTFIWSSTGTANGGTVFAGATGFWTRQYSGAVNVKWFGAVVDGITDDTVAIYKARALVKNTGGEINIGGVLGGAGTDLRALSNEYILGDGVTYKTDLTGQNPLIHSYVFNGTPTVGAGYAHYGTRLDYQTKPLINVQSAVGFASMMQSYSTNTLGALLGNNTNKVAGVFNASAMDGFSSAGVEAINAIVYSGYTGAEPQSVIGIEVDLTVTNPAGFFNEAGKSFAVGISSNLTGTQDGSIGITTGQSSGLTNGWLYGGLFAGCKNVGISVARQYVTPDVGIWVSASTTYGMYIGAKSLHSINSVNAPAYDSLHNPVIGVALGQRASISGESNKIRLIDTNASGIEHSIDMYADTSNDLQIEFDGVRKLTIAPNGNLYIANTQILSSRVTGYTAMSGTANKATAYDTSSITLVQLAERVKSLQDSLSAHGIIGA